MPKCVCQNRQSIKIVPITLHSFRQAVGIPKGLLKFYMRISGGPIVKAVQDGRIQALKLLVAGPSHFSSDDARQGLIVASSNGDVSSVDVLLGASISPDTTDHEGVPVLSRAVAAGHVDVARRLLTAGCSVDKRCRSSAAVHQCVINGQDGCLVALIEAGANINLADSSGNTPLILATKFCHRSMKAMKCLLEAGCDLECCDQEMRTALHYACYRAVGVEMLLSAGAKTDPQDADGNSPLHMASIEGFDTIVLCLITFNCNPNVINFSGKMAVHYLAMKGHWRSIEGIARVGGLLDHPDNNGFIPLWYAVEHGRIDAVRTLLLANCKPNVNNCHPLESALRQRNYLVAQWLLLAGACRKPLCKFLREFDGDDAPVRCFNTWVQQPLTLRLTCRNVIRVVLRGKQPFDERVKSLGCLPVVVQDFICLREMRDTVD